MWELVKTADFDKKAPRLAKKHRQEVKNAADNLAAYFADLQSGLLPQQIIRGYVHTNYKKGIKSLDEKGPGKGRKKAIRLYIYPDEEKEDLIAITIGDKSSQNRDVKHCESYVEDLLSKRENQEQEKRGY